jgi:hypothetical protein
MMMMYGFYYDLKFLKVLNRYDFFMLLKNASFELKTH